MACILKKCVKEKESMNMVAEARENTLPKIFNLVPTPREIPVQVFAPRERMNL